jgi:hypothetical protein
MWVLQRIYFRTHGSDTMRKMIANPRQQQIPPLRCAPVGMTNYVDNFRNRMLDFYNFRP